MNSINRRKWVYKLQKVPPIPPLELNFHSSQGAFTASRATVKVNLSSSIGLLMEDEINASGAVSLSRAWGRFCDVWSLHCGLAPDHPIVAGLMGWFVPCKHRPSCGQTHLTACQSVRVFLPSSALYQTRSNFLLFHGIIPQVTIRTKPTMADVVPECNVRSHQAQRKGQCAHHPNTAQRLLCRCFSKKEQPESLSPKQDWDVGVDPWKFPLTTQFSEHLGCTKILLTVIYLPPEFDTSDKSCEMNCWSILAARKPWHFYPRLHFMLTINTFLFPSRRCWKARPMLYSSLVQWSVLRKANVSLPFVIMKHQGTDG